MDNYIRSIDGMLGLQNIELELTNLIKKEEHHRIVAVSLEDRKIIITFSGEVSQKKYPNFVKQISKKKYKDCTQFILNSPNFGDGALLKASISIGDKWLLFFTK